MYSREAFTAQVAVSAAQERSDGLWLVLASVGGGIAQLILIRWADRILVHRTALAIEGSVFLLYIAVVLCLLWRFQTHKRDCAPHCPDCGVSLQGLSLRLAIATGKCDRCGAQVIGT